MSEAMSPRSMPVDSPPAPFLERQGPSAAFGGRSARWASPVLDGGIAIILGITLAILASWGATRVSPVAYSPAAEDIYFNADVVRVVANMTDRFSDHFRIKVHPLFLLAAYPPTVLVEKLAHVSPVRAAQLVNAGIGGIWIAGFYLLLRRIRLPRLDALVFCVAAATSAGAIFWFTVPETYAFGAVTLLLPLILTATERRHELPAWVYVAVSGLSMGITVTNWMAGILATVARFPLKKAAMVTVHAFYFVVTIWGVQQAVFRGAPFFLDFFVERHVVARQEWGGVIHRAGAIFCHAMLMPEIKSMGTPANPATGRPARPDHQIMTVQLSRPGSASVYGLIGLGAWALLLVAGGVAMVISRDEPHYRFVLGALVAGQVGLHLVYGEEAFLYALHYVPLLVLVAAFAARTRIRYPVLALACVLIACNVLNNAQQFKEANSLAGQLGLAAITTEGSSNE